MVCITRDDANLLVVSENGYGKRSQIDDYRITNRGGKGVKTLNITEKTGKLVAIREVGDDDELMIINRSGITIRIAMSELRIMGRATQGVRLIKLNDDDRISSVEKIQKIEGIKTDGEIEGIKTEGDEQKGIEGNSPEENSSEEEPPVIE
jgi:DNA gyrase subunit A